MNATRSNAALLEAPVGDLPILRRETTKFFRLSGFVTVGDITTNTLADFATSLQSYYAMEAITSADPQSTVTSLAKEQIRAIAVWLAANNLHFATTSANPA